MKPLSVKTLIQLRLNIMYFSLWITLITKIWISQNWNTGWYLSSTIWQKWDDSWKTWSESSKCDTCENYMFLDSTSKLWSFWLENQYYDYTYQIWRDWDGKWNNYWKGQKLWFEWDSAKVFDLETLTWVPDWNKPKIKLTNLQYSIRSICRSFEFYIDPLSPEIIELGTISYPYKSMRAISSEILNIFSHLNVNITIYLKENTTVYISDYTSYFLNITSIKIMSYSADSFSIAT